MIDNNQYSAKANIQNCIKEFMERNNISYIQFAKAIGVSDTSVKRWANGVCSPDIDLLPFICEYIGVSIFELFGLKRTDNITSNEIDILKLYAGNINFKTLIDRYRSDPTFKEHIDYIVNLQK